MTWGIFSAREGEKAISFMASRRWPLPVGWGLHPPPPSRGGVRLLSGKMWPSRVTDDVNKGDYTICHIRICMTYCKVLGCSPVIGEV